MTGLIPASGRILAIDYGRKRVGLAITDSLRITAQPFQTLQGFKNKAELSKLLKSICEEQKVVGVVIGLPRNMDGSHGEMAQEVEGFAESFKAESNLPIKLWDERMTSMQASRVLVDTGKKPSKNKDKIDQLAAAFILRNYLDSSAL